MASATAEGLEGTERFDWLVDRALALPGHTLQPDGDSGDDCAGGTDGTGPLPDNDPANDGEGFLIEILAGGRAVMYWFTFDEDGEQAWYLAAGDPVRTESLVRPIMAVMLGLMALVGLRELLRLGRLRAGAAWLLWELVQEAHHELGSVIGRAQLVLGGSRPSVARPSSSVGWKGPSRQAALKASMAWSKSSARM